MNRAEYRRQTKAAAKKEKQYNLKMSDIEQLRNKMRDEAVVQASNTAFILLLSLPLIVLRDKYGFGRKRLEDFQEFLLAQYECFSAGMITLDELKGIILAETGMQVKTEKDFEVQKE